MTQELSSVIRNLASEALALEKLPNKSDLLNGKPINNWNIIGRSPKKLFDNKHYAMPPKEGLPVAALNAAILSDALFIEIRAGWKSEVPLHIVLIGCGDHVGFPQEYLCLLAKTARLIF